MVLKRVVHVITALNQGGAEAMLEKLIRASRRATPDVDHQVFSLGSLGTVGARLVSLGVPVTALEIRGPFTFARGIARLWAQLKETEVGTVVQTWLYHADVVGGMVARTCGIREVFWNIRQTLNGEVDLRLTTRVVLRLSAWMSSRVPFRIICCAESARSSHVGVGYDPKRCVVIDNGFDTVTMSRSEVGRRRFRSAWGIGDDELLIGVVGRLDPLKDHDNFLRTAALVSRAETRARFVLVGRDVDTDEGIRQSIVSNGIQNITLAIGQQDDMASVMSALDVLVVSSRSEGFPNVLGEAMSCEVPCATTDVGDARRIVGHEQFVVPPGEPDELARVVISLCKMDACERRSLGRALRDRVESNFGIERTWDAYRRVYSESGQ